MHTPFPTTLTHFAGQEIAGLVAQHGTPLYVYDSEIIAERIDQLAPFDTIRYAQKACSNLAVLDFVRRRGVLVDAVSAGEVLRALAAGYRGGQSSAAPEIVYTADVFDHESLDLVVEHDLRVNCGSPDMIAQYGERCRAAGRERGITIRVNPGFGHGHSQKVNTGGTGSKHGVWHEQVADCAKRANEFGLTVDALHMHIGSGTDLEHLGQVCAAMERVAREVGPSVHAISAGGGLPTPYKPGDEPVSIDGYHKLWNATRESLAERFGHTVHLEIEPGRFLTAESGVLLAEVRAVKTMGERLYCLLDAGFNNLARPVMYGAYHPIALCPRKKSGEGVHERETVEVVVGGPLCESGDIFTQEEGGFVCAREMPRPEVGDCVALGAAGAYGFVMSSNYNSKPMAAELLVVDGVAHLVRERQKPMEMWRGESIPTT